MRDVHIDVEDDIIRKMSDMSSSLAKWKAVIETLIDKYGEDTRLAVDAGHNNVEFKLFHEVKGHEIQQILNNRSKNKATDVQPKKAKVLRRKKRADD